jgi:hypothetical protein
MGTMAIIAITVTTTPRSIAAAIFWKAVAERPLLYSHSVKIFEMVVPAVGKNGPIVAWAVGLDLLQHCDEHYGKPETLVGDRHLLRSAGPRWWTYH